MFERMGSGTSNDREDGEGITNIRVGNVDRGNFDIVDSFRRAFDELSDDEEDEIGAAAAADANDLLTTANVASRVSDNTMSEKEEQQHRITLLRYFDTTDLQQ